MKAVLLLATLETKSEEIGYLQNVLETSGVEVNLLDISLRSNGETWEASQKITQMNKVVQEIATRINKNHLTDSSAVLGLGGGTGGEIILQILRQLPFDFPKILVTTLPFDPRFAVSDNSIVLIPTLSDIEGLNSSLRLVLENTAHMLEGLARHEVQSVLATKSIGLTNLGVTQNAARAIISRLRQQGHETTSFHANGFGGAAFSRFAKAGAFTGVIDMTVHEITRIHVAGVHADMPDRFTAAGHLPCVMLPGGLNFIGLGEIELVPPHFLERRHYQHSGYFTHVKMSKEEIELSCTALAHALNQGSGPTRLVLPMGGFSSEDCPGGAIEDRELRNIAAECFKGAAKSYDVIILDSHINDEETADFAVNALMEALQEDSQYE